MANSADERGATIQSGIADKNIERAESRSPAVPTPPAVRRDIHRNADGALLRSICEPLHRPLLIEICNRDLRTSRAKQWRCPLIPLAAPVIVTILIDPRLIDGSKAGQHTGCRVTQLVQRSAAQ